LAGARFIQIKPGVNRLIIVSVYKLKQAIEIFSQTLTGVSMQLYWTCA